MNIIMTKNLRKIYRMGENNVYALNGVDFTVKEGELPLQGRQAVEKQHYLIYLGQWIRPQKEKYLCEEYHWRRCRRMSKQYSDVVISALFFRILNYFLF